MGSLTTRVAIAAESATERAALAAMLAGSSAVTVVHTTDRGRDLESLLGAHDVDVAVIALASPHDLVLPLDVTGDLAHRVPALVVLVDDPLRPSYGATWLAAAFANGVHAVLPRDVNADELHAAVQAADHGLLALSPDQYTALGVGARPMRAALSGNTETLTPREAEILGMLADGLANKEIAARLRISTHTVKTHVQSLFVKLGADSRAEAVAVGVRRGLIHL